MHFCFYFLQRLQLRPVVTGSSMLSSDVPLGLNSEGYVAWFAPLELATSCLIDITFYPFDTQDCKFIIESWASSEEKVNL